MQSLSSLPYPLVSLNNRIVIVGPNYIVLINHDINDLEARLAEDKVRLIFLKKDGCTRDARRHDGTPQDRTQSGTQHGHQGPRGRQKGHHLRSHLLPAQNRISVFPFKSRRVLIYHRLHKFQTPPPSLKEGADT